MSLPEVEGGDAGGEGDDADSTVAHGSALGDGEEHEPRERGQELHGREVDARAAAEPQGPERGEGAHEPQRPPVEGLPGREAQRPEAREDRQGREGPFCCRQALWLAPRQVEGDQPGEQEPEPVCADLS